MFLKRRGSITVFICIVLAVIIPLSCILIDLGRYTMAKKQAETALKICSESMLAAYDRQLRDQYGLFALYPRDEKIIQQEIFELLSQNLNAGASMEGVSDLYGFKVRKVEVIPFYNLSEPYVLKQQAAEFMKYRAPAQVVQEFYEKIMVLLNFKKEADMVEKKMGLDRLMNDIRSSLVIIYKMLDEKLQAFNESNQSSKSLKNLELDIIKNNTAKVNEEIKKANNEVEPIKKAQDAYINIYPKYKDAKDKNDSTYNKYMKVKKRLDKKKSELNKVKSDLTTADDSQTKKLEAKKERLEDEIEAIRAEYDSAKEAYDYANDLYEALNTEINKYRNDLDERIKKVNTNLSIALETNNNSAYQLNILLEHISEHTLFHADLLALIDEIEPKLNELDNQSTDLLNETQADDSSVSDKIKGGLEKQLNCIKNETFTEIRAQLSSNLQRLDAWKQAISKGIELIEKGSDDLDYVQKSAVAVQNDLQNVNKRYLGYGGYGDVISGITTLESGLSDLKRLAEMPGIYVIPAYTLEPLPNGEEIKAFNNWFDKEYRGKNSEESNTSDDTELNQIRDGIGSFAEDVGQQEDEEEDSEDSEESDEDEENNIIPENFLTRVKYLPSIIGPTSSDKALRKIGDAIEETLSNQIVNESPLDKPVEGLDKVNENEKGFFNYEIQRILDLMEIVKNFVADGIESVVEDLYLNEYIVSAFKCETTVNEIEHDISWGRPIDKTFFNNAEVEYIIFGNLFEKDNISASKRSIFAMRLIFNLLHVYTDAEKQATALTLATTIAGWTIFGIPVVHNFLLISWAGLESYVDTEVLLKGQKVPLIKTASSWYLSRESAVDSIKNIFLKDIKNFASQQVEKQVENASEAIEETVMGIIDSKIDEAFGKFEDGLNQIVGETTSVIHSEVASMINETLLNSADFENMDSFAAGIERIANGFVQNLFNKLGSMAQDKLAQYKDALKTKIREMIFKSDLYVGLVNKIKGVGYDLIHKGFSAVEGQVDKAFGMAGKSRSNNMMARLIMMDYVDYLRLMLLAVPAEKKALRTADIMELNMQEVSKNYDLAIDKYNTYLFIKVELDMNTWFLPKELFKTKDTGMICIEWSQGY